MVALKNIKLKKIAQKKCAVGDLGDLNRNF